MSTSGITTAINDLGLPAPKIYYDFSSFSSNTEIDSVAPGSGAYSGEIINGDAAFQVGGSGSGYFRDQYIEISNVSAITNENATIIFSQQKTGVSPGVIFSSLNNPSGFELGITAANKLYYKNYINGSPNYQTLESYPTDKNIYAFTLRSNGAATLSRLNFQSPIPVDFALSFPNANNPITNVPESVPKVKYYNLTF